jgi:hypothetical protein
MGIVKRRRIIPAWAALGIILELAPAPALPPAPPAPVERVEGGDGSLYCVLAWIFRCHAQPSCVPSGCGVRLPSWGGF